ncbi:hypothetical protein WN944_024993 [Citrus x changshan-huyou]|uniref:non-specific serine/threonine protein kinase n=1 Tax=Citrus x changshan-huyou TaxID=2935761 RepID=A0AAP0LP02_9ROSI
MSSSLKHKLSKHTSFFGIPLWILIITLTLLFLLIFIAILFLYIFIFHRRKKSYINAHFRLPKNPISPKNHVHPHNTFSTSSLDRRLLSCNTMSEIEMNLSKPDLQFMFSDRWSSGTSTNRCTRAQANGNIRCSVSGMRLGIRISLKEIDIVTNGFAEQNVIASGENGVVYRAVLLDNMRAAVKLLMSNSVSEEEDFIEKVEAIGQVKHKNLVKLFGYCVEGQNRILVYEYIDNGNLQQWLHGSLGEAKPLTWDTRMKIVQGTAKGLAYLHEDIEPKIVHHNMKSSNILLDHHWNPKISDVGLAKLHGSEWSISTSCELRNSGYLAEELSGRTSIFNEKSDVYSFGILIMEIVSGRLPVDYSQPQVFLIDWLKSMVAQQKIAYVLDPKLPEMPSRKELKRIILIALRCVDPDIKHRPKMGDVLRMLEPRDLLLREEYGIKRAASYHNYPQKNKTAVLCDADISTHDEENRAHESDHENPPWKKF